MMTILSFLRGLFGVSARAAVASKPPASLKGAPEITSETEGGFHDPVLFIESHSEGPNREQVVRAVGTHNGQHLALEVVLGPAWKSGKLEGVEAVVYRGTVSYRSVGAASDAFLRAVDGEYGTNLKPEKMGKNTAFAALTLAGDPGDLAKGPVKLKLLP